MPCARPNASPSRVMLVRQSTTVPNTSKPSAFTSGGTVHLHFRGASLDADGGARLQRNRLLQAAHGRAADEHLGPDLFGQVLNAGGEVHRIAHEGVGQTLGTADGRGEDLAGVD